MPSPDSHIVMFAMTGELKPAEHRVLAAGPWGISDIVLWELTKLAQLGRIDIDLDDPDVVRFLSVLHVWPISREVCRAMRGLDFRGDPADELIAATSIAHKVPLLTRDSVIRKSKRVPLAR